MTDREFLDNVWRKYEIYVNTNNKDDFYKENHFKKNKTIIKLKLLVSYFLGLISLAGIAYAGVYTYKIIQTNTKTDFYINKEYNYNQDMLYSNSMYYKKIYTYDEYLESKKIWKNIVEMKQSDFEDSFIIIIAGENYDTMNLYVSDIYNDNQKLCIELRKRNTWEDNTIISVKVPKALDTEKVEIKRIANEVNIANQTKDINALTENYTMEDALNDNCFVIKLNEVISKDKERLNNFVNNCNKKIEDSIRLYIQETQRMIIYDIEYKNNQINMVCRIFKSNNDRTMYSTGNQIVIMRFDTYTDYILCNEIGGQKIICSINN